MRAILLGLLAVSAVAIATPAFARYPRWRRESGTRPRLRPLPSSAVSQLRSRLPHYHHPPRRRICPSHSALRLSSTDAKEDRGASTPGPYSEQPETNLGVNSAVRW